MKKITLIKVGIDLDLDGEKKPEEKKVVIEQMETTSEVPAQEKTIAVPQELMTKLLELATKGKGQVDTELASAIKKLGDVFEESRSGDTRNFLGARPVSVEEIDPEDLLEVPAIFFAHSVSFSVYDDKKNGRTVSSPYKRAFKFKVIQRTTHKSVGSRIPTYVSLSAVTVNSKKEADWLRHHTLFQIKFFEKLGEGKDISSEMQEQLAFQWNMVASLDDAAVIRRCVNESIPVTEIDVTGMRRKLAKKLAEKGLKDIRARYKQTLEETSDAMEGKFKKVTEQGQSPAKDLTF